MNPKHPTAHIANELGAPPEQPDPFTPKQRKIAIGILIFAAIVLVVIYAWHNGWLTDPKPLKDIRDEKKAVSDTIDNIVTGIKQKAKQSVHKQRTLTEDYKAFVPVIVETDSANEAFYLRDSIIKYN